MKYNQINEIDQISLVYYFSNMQKVAEYFFNFLKYPQYWFYYNLIFCMSEPVPEEVNKVQTKPQIKPENKVETKPDVKETKQEEQQIKKEAISTKPANQFVYYVPHENPKNEQKLQPRKIVSPSSSKSNSRSRSREKRQIKQSKTQKIKDFDSYKRFDKTEGKDKGSKILQDSKFKNDQLVKQEAYRKTKICPQFQRGQCRKGSECNFAHSQNQLRGLPDFRKTKLCLAFKQGKCGKLSSECRYAHGQTQLRRMPKISNDRQKKRSRSPYRKQKYHPKQPDYSYSVLPQAIVSSFNMPPPTYPPPYINPYQQPMVNTNEYIQPRPQHQPTTSYNPQNFQGRVYPQYGQPPVNQNSQMSSGGYGSYIPPPPAYYASNPYDYYGQYPVPPPHHPPPNSYGYPPGPKPPM